MKKLVDNILKFEVFVAHFLLFPNFSKHLCDDRPRGNGAVDSSIAYNTTAKGLLSLVPQNSRLSAA